MLLWNVETQRQEVLKVPEEEKDELSSQELHMCRQLASHSGKGKQNRAGGDFKCWKMTAS